MLLVLVLVLVLVLELLLCSTLERNPPPLSARDFALSSASQLGTILDTSREENLQHVSISLWANPPPSPMMYFPVVSTKPKGAEGWN